MGITTSEKPCWKLVRSDRREEDFEPHYPTREKAEDAAARFVEIPYALPTAAEEEHLCSVATAACGYVYDVEGEGEEHWTDAGQLRKHVISAGWRELPGGELHCSADPGACEECDKLDGPPSPDLNPLPGQIALPMGAGQ